MESASSPPPPNSKNLTWFSGGPWRKQIILCQELQNLFHTDGIWNTTNPEAIYPRNSYYSLLIFTLCIIMVVTTLTLFVLKPLRMPFTAQMIGGVLIVGSIFSVESINAFLFSPFAVQYILKTISFVGFMFHSLMLGVETNMIALVKRINKKSAIISFSGYFLSFTFSLISLLSFVSLGDWPSMAQGRGYYRIMGLNAQTYFMVTCNHLNDLGISNSELGRLAYTMALCLDITGMVGSFIAFEVLPTISSGDYGKPLTIIGFYLFLLGIVRPYILKIIAQCAEDKKIKSTHFVFIILIGLLTAGIGDVLGQMFAVFLFALSLPDDPLASILAKRLDAMTFGLFFPIYCATLGSEMDILNIDPTTSFRIEIGLIFGTIGKMIGIYMSAVFMGLPLNNALALSLIMSCKGLFDVSTLGLWINAHLIDMNEFTVSAFHFLVFSGALLPFVRYLYKPSSEYSNILGTSVMDISESGALKVMACIHKEENISGIIRLIEAFDPSKTRPIPLIAVQLNQLMGRVSIPIFGLLDQVKLSGDLGTKLIRCERIVDYLSNLERLTKGSVRIQHYVSVAPYESIHNDVCNLAYERDISLLILPFHISNEVKSKDNFAAISTLSLPIRSFNKMILDKSPCAVGVLIDKTNLHLSISMTQVYRIAIIYLGGLDDQEALAYTNLFATNPNISVMIYCLKSRIKGDQDFDYILIDEIREKIDDNDRISFNEIIVNDGGETTDFIVSIKGKVDLVIGGRNHGPKCGPLFGLSDGWTEYPELGILGDMLASSEFKFSVLVVHSSNENGQLM